MKKILAGVIGIVLIPVSVALTIVMVQILAACWSFKVHAELLFLAGFGLYLIMHLVLYKPVFVHVMAHEFTHALFAVLMAGRVDSMQISSKGGRVTSSRTNFLITLAPYFIPFYTLIVVGLYFIVKEKYIPYTFFLMGFTLAFHLCLTVYSLRLQQTDLKESGLLFSLSFVYLMNIVIIGLIFTLIIPEFAAKTFFIDSYRLINAWASFGVSWVSNFFHLKLK